MTAETVDKKKIAKYVAVEKKHEKTLLPPKRRKPSKKLSSRRTLPLSRRRSSFVTSLP